MAASSNFDGYHSFADFIAFDAELSVFKRFDRLSARNLLYIQTELIEAERLLDEFDQEDFDDNSIQVRYVAKCWETFQERAGEHAREHSKMEIILRIRRLMKEYHEGLLLRSQVLRLRRPTSRVLEVFSNWFNNSKPFAGSGKLRLQERHDFVALSTAEEQDRLSTLIQRLGGKLLPASKETQGDGVKYYSENAVRNTISCVSILAAALLLEGAIVTLYLVTNPHIRLGLIAIFTCTFAGCVGLMTSARRSEMFAGTAAYTAVLVVFVSGDLSGQRNPP